MLELLTRNWWVLALRGVLAILLGILCFAWPGVALVALVIVIGVYILADGILAVITGLSERVKGWGLLLLEGILLIILGFAVFRWPGITAVALLVLFALRAIIVGVLEIAEAIRLRKQVEGEWLLGLAGVLSVIFGVLLLVMPRVGPARHDLGDRHLRHHLRRAADLAGLPPEGLWPTNRGARARVAWDRRSANVGG